MKTSRKKEIMQNLHAARTWLAPDPINIALARVHLATAKSIHSFASASTQRRWRCGK